MLGLGLILESYIKAVEILDLQWLAGFKIRKAANTGPIVEGSSP